MILAEGGCYGHFLACLIRSMWDINFTLGKNFTKSGACDFISCAHAITALMNKKYSGLYPEKSEIADTIVEILKTKEYTTVMNEYELGYDYIDTFHYLKKDNVEKFLTVDNVKIIYVTMEKSDANMAALNKISKNFDVRYTGEWVESTKNNYKSWIKNNIEELDKLTSFSTMSNDLKKELVLFAETNIKNRCLLTKPDSNERILFLKFKDIINNNILEDLAAFTNTKVNDSTIEFYQKYLEAQKIVHNYIQNN